MKKLLIVFFSASLLVSCSKETLFIDNPPQLEIVVFDVNIIKIQNASITIYLTEEDWQSKTNSIAQQNTDSNGTALFKNLEEVIYYFYVQKANLDNTLGISYFANPLKKNEIRVVQTTIN